MNNSSPATPFDRLTQKLGNRSSWLFSIVSIVSVVSTLFVSLNYGNNLIILLPLSATIGLVPLFVKKGATILYNWKEETAEFLKYSRRFQSFADVRFSILAGCVFMIIASVIYVKANSFDELSLFGKTASWLVFGGSTFIGGIGILSIVHLCLLFRDIGKCPVEVTDTTFGIMSSGNKLLSCYSLGCIGWFLYSFSGFGTILYSKNPLYYLSLPSFVFLVGSFIFAQYPLHNRMVEFKKKRIQHIQKLIEGVYPKEAEKVNKEQLELLERLSGLSKEASKLPVWPFNFGTFLGVISGALGAIFPSLLSIGLEYFLR
jgi:hypothetical protein